MSAFSSLVKRNTKLYFKDKGLFFTSLITPLILLFLYGTFLANVYESSFKSSVSAFGLEVSEQLASGYVAGQILSSLLAVCCVTVAFCSNMLMVQDKVTGARGDLTMAPVKSSTLAAGYYASTFISTLIVCLSAAAMAFVFVAIKGWYMSALDVVLIIVDVVILVMFGTALSSIVCSFLTSQAQISAVGTIVSTGYGFISGAYMPISQFSTGLQRLISCMPGTYGTVLLKNHALRGVFEEMGRQGFPADVLEENKDLLDVNFYFFGHKVSIPAMYAVIVGTVAVLVAAYIAINYFKGKKKKVK